MSTTTQDQGCIISALQDTSTFESWLLSKGEKESVGIANEFGACPIASFLYEHCRVDVHVTTSGIHLLNSTMFYDADKNLLWVKKFVSKVDRSKRGRTVRVLRDQALKILSEVKEMVG